MQPLPAVLADTAQAGASDSLTLAAGAPTALPYGLRRLTGGAGSVQDRIPAAYNGTTKVATVSPRWRVNLLERSEEIDDAAWTKFGSGTGSAPVVTANFAAAPDGSLTAERVQFDKGAGTGIGDLSELKQNVPGLTNPHTSAIAVWLRSNDENTYTPRLRHNVTPTDVQITPQWQKFEVVRGSLASTTGSFELITRGDIPTLSQTADVLFWAAQFVEGDELTDYIKTEAAAITLPDATTGYEIVPLVRLRAPTGVHRARDRR